jgi:hypothetical protein
VKNGKVSPSRWLYGLAALIVVVGIVLFIVVIVSTISDIGKSLTHVVVPGSHDITLEKPGAYIVFYEYRSVVDGRLFSTNESLPGLHCTLVNVQNSDEIVLRPAAVDANYSVGGRAGFAVFEFTIDQPGTYELYARYDEGQEGPDIVLAIGTSVTTKVVGSIFGGFAILFGSFVIALVLAIVTFVKRHKSAKQIAQSA